jgi:hypothetical protein
MADKFDPPWRLDPLKNIVNVGWGGALAVLYFDYIAETSSLASQPAFAWNAVLTDGNDAPSMRGLSLLDELGPKVTPPGPPKSAPPPESIPGNNDFWSYPREFKNDVVATTSIFHVVDRGIYNIATSSGIITSYFDALDPTTDKLPFAIDNRSPPVIPPSGKDGPYVVLPGNNQGNQLIGYMQFIVDRVTPGASFFQNQIGELISHDSVEVVNTYTRSGKTITFLNIGRIGARNPPIKTAKKLKIVMQMLGVNSRTFLRWNANLAVFLGGAARKFAVDATSPVGVRPVPDKPPVGLNKVPSTSFSERTTPVATVTFIIDLQTYQITSTKVYAP